MPKVPAMLEEVTGKEPYRGLSPHTAVAQGAAIHAAILEAKYRGADSELAEKVRKHLSAVKQENVNSHGLGVVARNPKTGKSVNHVMIPRNSRLPIERQQVFHTSHDGPAAREREGDGRGRAGSEGLLADRQLLYLRPARRIAQGRADRGDVLVRHQRAA